MPLDEISQSGAEQYAPTKIYKMLIKTPQFWQKRNFISRALLPLSLLYLAVSTLINFSRKSQKISKPVICIGNLTVGGSGKTPVALAIGEILHELGVNFAYLSRGYGAKEIKFGFVEKNSTKAREAGDEPLLLAQIAPTFIAKNRLNGAKAIDAMPEFSAVLIDDGMQNNSLQKDILILVIDGKIQFGNRFIFPAGPLRQGIKNGLKKADFVVVVGEIDEKLQKILAQKKVVKAEIIAKNLHEFTERKLIAFCGLAYPEKFFSFLENVKLNVIETKSFPDHHFYDKIELEKLLETAQQKGSWLITTKKDWVKFAPEFQAKIKFLDIDLEFANKEFIKSELRKILKL